MLFYYFHNILTMQKLLKTLMCATVIALTLTSKAQSLDATTAGGIAGALSSSSNPAFFNIRIAPNISFGNNPNSPNIPAPNSVEGQVSTPVPQVGNAQTLPALPVLNANGAVSAVNPNAPATPNTAIKKTEPVAQDIGYQQKLADDLLRSQSTVAPTGLETINKTTIDYYTNLGREREQKMLMQGLSK